jgi:hypothetical protein
VEAQAQPETIMVQLEQLVQVAGVEAPVEIPLLLKLAAQAEAVLLLFATIQIAQRQV